MFIKGYGFCILNLSIMLTESIIANKVILKILKVYSKIFTIRLINNINYNNINHMY